MMKKYITLFSLFLAVLVFSQDATYQDVKARGDISEIEGFIKNHPKHPNNRKLRYLLIKLRREQRKAKKNKAKSYSVHDFRSKIAKERNSFGSNEFKEEIEDGDIVDNFSSKNNTSSRYRRKSKRSNGSTSGNETELLNHLFSTSKNKKKAYLQIKNDTDCPINMSIKGRKNYSLKIKANSEGHILVMKGIYNLSGRMCNKSYSQKQKIKGDIILRLNN